MDADIPDVSPVEIRFPFDTLRPDEEKELWATDQDCSIVWFCPSAWIRSHL